MSIIVKPFTFSAGGTIIASDHNSNYDTIYNDYNGNITNANLASGAAIADTKLAQITTGQKVNLSSLVATSQATGDIIYASSATVMSRLATDTNATRYLSNTGASNIPAWAQVNAANGITGTLPVANGGTGSASALLDYGTSASASSAITSLKMACGSLSVTGSSSQAVTNLGFTSSSSYYVVLTINNSSTFTQPTATRASGASFTIYNQSSSTISIFWLAIGS